MTILYFGFYNPTYARNAVLINGLKANGAKVIECREGRRSAIGWAKLILKYLRYIGKYDIMIVGFPGQEAMFLARFLTRNPIVFDAFTSHYGGYILDRGYHSKDSFRARYYRFLDKWSCKFANLVLLDTQAHIDFFVEEFKLPKEKFRRVFVGTNSEIFYPRISEKKDSRFLVHFHGHYIPLQGVKFIIEAAKLLERENVHFNLIGRGQTYDDNIKLASRLRVNNINFIDPVPYEELPNYISTADICLGIFGDSPKTELVIPNKIFEALAMAKAVVTADTTAARELLIDRENVLFCHKADPKSLAEKILELKNNTEKKNKISRNGFKLFNNHLTEKIIGSELSRILETISK